MLVGFVRAATNYDRLSLQSLAQLLKKKEVKVNTVIDVESSQLPDDIIASGKLKQLRSNARIIIVELGMDIIAATNFMLAVYRSDMKTDEYVYIIPWLSHVSYKLQRLIEMCSGRSRQDS
ncbi:hypothetical protein COOONC_00591 [Cooperia oncophora]